MNNSNNKNGVHIKDKIPQYKPYIKVLGRIFSSFMLNKMGSKPRKMKMPVTIPHRVSMLAKIKQNIKYKSAGK